MKRQRGGREGGREHLEPSALQHQGLSSDQLSSGRRPTLPLSPAQRERPLRGQEIKERQVGKDKDRERREDEFRQTRFRESSCFNER